MSVLVTGWGATTPTGTEAGDSATLPTAARTRLARSERLTQLLVSAAGPALARAGLADSEGAVRVDLGVSVGTAFGCFLTNVAFEERLLQGGVAAASPRLFAATVSNAAAGELAITYRLGGPCTTLTAGRAAGLLALGEAAEMVHAGRATAMVAAGADALGPALAAFLAVGGLPVSTPLAGGAAALVLETEASARGRAVTPYARLRGHAGGFDVRADGTGLRSTVEAALADARLEPAAIARVVTSVPSRLADLLAPALSQIFPPPSPSLESLGSSQGETLAAGGVLGVMHAFATSARHEHVLVVEACGSGHVAAVVIECWGQP